MKGENIICSLIKLLDILECRIEKKTHAHGRAIICGHIASEEENQLLSNVNKQSLEQIYALDEKGEKHCLFTGIVEELKIEIKAGVKKAWISFVSGTVLLDSTPRTRVFQDISMSYESVFQQIAQNYSDAQFIVQNNTAIGEFIVQYEETDWEFLKRMASRKNAVVIPFFQFGQIRCSVGILNLDVTTELTAIEFSKYNHLLEYEKEKKRGTFLPMDMLAYEVTSREIVDLGAAVWFEKQLYYAYEVHSFLEKGELLHRYSLRTQGAFGCSRKQNERIIGASLDATVIDIKQDKVKVIIKAEGKQEKQTAEWFPFSTVYSSPDGTGWFCMPEIGDQMRLYFPNEIEKNAYVISAVHEEISEKTAQVYQAQHRQPPRSNPDNKSIMNKYQKEVELTPTSITLTNHKGMMIRLDDEEGIQIISDKDIKIESTKDLSLSSKEENLSIEGKQAIELIQGSTKMIFQDEVIIEGAKLKLQ